MLEKLTEGIQSRMLSREGDAVLAKWEETGLLEGLNSDNARNNMARLLENQAAELLRESSTMSAGDVEGFAAVAFPIVRRVFGGLLAQELVSVQPMSLPSGLIFFMDFQHNSARLGTVADASVYGGGKVGAEIVDGVSLGGANAEAGFYNLNNGYSAPLSGSGLMASAIATTIIASGTVGGTWTGTRLADADDLLRFDPDLSGSEVVIATIAKSDLPQLNEDNLITVDITSSLAHGRQVRRATRQDPANAANLIIVLEATGSETTDQMEIALNAAQGMQWAIDDNFNASGIGGVVGDVQWGLENNETIPEIDLKVDQVAVTAMTRKLKAKWSPELAQDLNAYHNLDAEVELTSILSEHIALEIDQEILKDLVEGATAGNLHWDRRPGNFVNREDGSAIAGGDFTGTVSEWYETLLETVNDLSARMHRKTLRGGANFLVCGPEVASILEFTSGFRASVENDADKGTWGALKAGSLSKKMDVFVDPYFPRQLALVGRRGSAFLESGYVYAPYVPLQVTPTIFGTEDFVPRRGVMTRYAKKMVVPDCYGLVVVHHLLG
jgi:hypothetical protein